jgi:hypothetical protein
MSNPRLKFLKNEAIEGVTASRIREYEAKAGVTVKLPVPVEKIVEQVLGLNLDWDEIEERPGEQILGGLVAAERKIVLNEKHLALFEAKPGLERSTIGHEAGHWDIDIDRARINHPTFPGFEVQAQVVKRHARKADRLIEVLFNRAMHDDRAYRLYKKLTKGQDTPEVRSAVDRYQSALLMPAWLIREAEGRFDFTKWRDLYRLAKEAQVNITNLIVRLHRLGLIFIPEDSKTIYRSKDEYTGQGSLF